MGRNNNARAGGVFDQWKNIGYVNRGFKQNPVNTQERAIELMYIRLLTDLCASRFKWTNIPPEIDIRFLELTLFYHALSVFYHDGRYDKYLALRGTHNGWLDYQNNPTGFNVIGNNFPSIPVSAVRETELPSGKRTSDGLPIVAKIGQAVPIWANKQRVPDIDVVLVYAKKLANLDRTVEINSTNARMPKVIATSEAANLTMSNINRQIDEGQNHIKVKGNVDLSEAITAFDLNIDSKDILSLDMVRDRQWNKCMTLLGIESANQDKKERLVSDEVGANDEQTAMMRFVNLNERRVAAEKINKLYKLDIEVDYYTDEEREQEMKLAAKYDGSGKGSEEDG